MCEAGAADAVQKSRVEDGGDLSIRQIQLPCTVYRDDARTDRFVRAQAEARVGREGEAGQAIRKAKSSHASRFDTSHPCVVNQRARR